MVRKVQNSIIPECEDIHLIPPIILNNSLPVPLYAFVLNENGLAMKIEKGQEKHLSIFSQDEQTQIDIWIDGFEKTKIDI